MLNIGIELEYPESPDGKDPMKNGAEKSNGLKEELANNDIRPPMGGRHTSDGTVGLETVSPVLDVDQGRGWFIDALNHIKERGGEYAPTSIINSTGSDSTAGLHIHVSSISEDTARDLYELSLEPDVRLLACSRVVEEEGPNYPVFRGKWCSMEFNGGRDSVVNKRQDGKGRYEWRLPEPQSKKHVGNLFSFLRILHNSGKESALEFAKEKVEAGETTSIQRAKAIGKENLEVERGKGRVIIKRTLDSFGSIRDSCSYWYYNVMEDEDMPYIYALKTEGGSDVFFGFSSSQDGTFHKEGVCFNKNTVFRADGLEEVEGGIRTAVNDEIDSRCNGNSIDEERKETKAKKRLKEVV